MRVRPCGLRFAPFVFLCLTVASFAAHAQSPQPPVPPSEEFETFRKDLEATIPGDLQRSRYHFVVLFNLARTDGPAVVSMVKIYDDLIKKYLVEEEGHGDLISFSPFQNELWPESYATGKLRYWNNEFSEGKIPDLINLRPTSSDPNRPRQKGHDIEKAVCAAVRRIANPESAIFIVLSDSPSTDPNEGPSMTQEPNWDAILRQHLIGEARPNGAGTEANRKGTAGKADNPAYYSIYYSKNLSPLSRLVKSRTDLGKERGAPPPPPPASHHTVSVTGKVLRSDSTPTPAPATIKFGSQVITAAADGAFKADNVPSDLTEAAVAADQELTQNITFDLKNANTKDLGTILLKEKDDSGPIGIILGVIVLALAVGGAVYGVWLKKPRSVQVTTQGATATSSVVCGKRSYIGGEGCQFVLPGLAKGQRLAMLDVNLTGNVVMRGEGLFKVGTGKGEVTVLTTPKNVPVTNTQSKAPFATLSVKRLS